MCGRFTLTAEIEWLKKRFQALFTDREYCKRYNIAPGQTVLAVINDGKQNRLGYLRWGLIPSWAKEPSIGNKMINARAETVLEKPAFRQAFQSRRCIIVADSFYEWEKDPDSGKKIPNRIMLKSREPFAMAGLYEKWRSPEGADVFTCTILTTAANDRIQPLHNRMPVILAREEEGIWLNRTLSNSQTLTSLLDSYPSGEMELYRVSAKVNSPKYDFSDCIEPQ